MALGLPGDDEDEVTGGDHHALVEGVGLLRGARARRETEQLAARTLAFRLTPEDGDLGARFPLGPPPESVDGPGVEPGRPR